MDDSTEEQGNHGFFGQMSINGTEAASSIEGQVAGASTPESPLYRAMLTGMHAYELWEQMDDLSRLQVILTHFGPEQWLEAEQLVVLVQFRSTPPGTWARIKLRYKEIGGNPYDLERAVDQLLAQQPAAGAPSVPFQPIFAAELYAMNLPPLAYVIEEILPVGATLFAGLPKDGKSLAVWNTCIAVAEGGLAFGRYRAQQGEVLYVDLEDGHRRARNRLSDQMQAIGMTRPPARMELVLWDAPRVGEGLEEKLVQWIDGHSNARLIAIDILEKIRPRRTRNVYEDDYRALASLQRLAQERDIAVMVVHHERKGKADDFRDLISGAMSLAGAADTLWVLKRTAGEAEATLHITGRDVDTKELAMQFADGFWTALGDAGAVPRNAAHQAILEALTVSEQPLTSRMLAALLGVNHHTAKSHLTRLRKRGFVRQSDRGGYIPGSNHRMRRGE